MADAAAPLSKAYESMGTHWQVTVWDPISGELFESLIKEILVKSAAFDATYSRFKKESLV